MPALPARCRSAAPLLGLLALAGALIALLALAPPATAAEEPPGNENWTAPNLTWAASEPVTRYTFVPAADVVHVRAVQSAIRVSPGANATGTFYITNRAPEPLTFSLGVVEPGLAAPGFRFRLLQSVEPDTLTLAPGAQAPAFVRVFAPPLMPRGPAPDVTFTVRAPGMPVPFIVPLRVEVEPTPASAPEALAPAAAAPLHAADPELPMESIALGAGGVGAAGTALWLLRRRETWRYLLLTPLVGLYTRLAKPQVLDNATRDRIYRLIVDTPGANYSTLKAQSGLASGVLVHHLRTLERHQYVTSRREGPHRRFYPTGIPLPAPEPKAPALTPMQTRILGLIGEEGISQRALQERLGLTQQGASYHMRTLERKGFLEARYEGDEWRWRRAPAADAAR